MTLSRAPSIIGSELKSTGGTLGEGVAEGVAATTETVWHPQFHSVPFWRMRYAQTLCDPALVVYVAVKP